MDPMLNSFSEPEHPNFNKGPDVSRMSKEERDAYFAKKRRNKELEALKKMGLSPEDFPSAHSGKMKPLGGSRGGEGRRGSDSRSSMGEGDRQREPCQPSYGEEKVSGWGSSSTTISDNLDAENRWGVSEPVPVFVPGVFRCSETKFENFVSEL